MKLRDLVEFNPTEHLPRDAQVPFVDMAALPQLGRDIQAFSLRDPASSGARFVNGDTLVARITPCLENGKGAQVRILPDNTVGQGSTEFIVLRAKLPSDADFVYNLSRHPDFQHHAIRQMTGTSGRQRVSWQSLADYEFPDIDPRQRALIGSVLGALDDKIELNRRVNETLEAIGRAIFQDWFVEFGPVRAKMEGHAPYLAAEIWALFPKDIDIDGRPEGWNGGNLSDFANLNPESWSRANYPDSVNYVDLSSTKWGTIEAVTPFTSDDAPSRAQRILRPGDTIVGTVRPGNGSYAFVSSDGLTGSTGFAVLRPIQDIYREAVYLAASSRENIGRLAHLADGGAYPAVRP